MRLLENLMGKSRIALTASLLGLATAVSGCSGINKFTEGEGLTLLGAAMGESDDSLSIKLAPYIFLLGQMRRETEVIRERSNINLNINRQPGQQPNQQQAYENIVQNTNGTYNPALGYTWVNEDDETDLRVRKAVHVIVAGNTWRDFNDDTIVDMNEVFGLFKERFEGGEGLFFLTIDENSFNNYPDYPGENRFEIYNPRGEKIYELDFNAPSAVITYDSASVLGYGNFRAVLFSDGEFSTSYDFEIVPSGRK